MQRVLAGLPIGMPGIGDEIDGAMQHAPQALRHLVVMMNVGMESKSKSGFANAVKRYRDCGLRLQIQVLCNVLFHSICYVRIKT